MNELKDRLKIARKTKNMTQFDVVSGIAGLSQSAYSQLESGKVKSSGKIVEIAQFLNVNPQWLATGQGEMNANIGNVSIGGNNTGIIGQGNTQNNYGLSQTVLPSVVADESPKHLKDMPLLDIDDAVAFALDPINLSNKIYATVQHISAFIPHSARTFAIKNDIDLSGIGEVLRQDDTLIFEPAMPPRNGDVVLICLDYGGANRGIVARLGVDLMGNNTIKYDDNPPTQMPPNSLICAVMTKFVHKMHNVDVLQSRLNPNYDILSTLVTE